MCTNPIQSQGLISVTHNESASRTSRRYTLSAYEDDRGWDLHDTDTRIDANDPRYREYADDGNFGYTACSPRCSIACLLVDLVCIGSMVYDDDG